MTNSMVPRVDGVAELRIARSVEERLPAAIAAAAPFHKTHSQFQEATLNIGDLTPIRAVRHILAKIERAHAALIEADLNCRKKEVEMARKKRAIGSTKDKLDRQMLEIEAHELCSQLFLTRANMDGAVRKLSVLLAQRERLMVVIGKSEITEEDFERAEARHHTMTAMKQALIAARSRGGIIDEGNHIYLFDLGINGADAQTEVFAYLQMESALLKDGKAPTHAMTVRWLEACADKWESEPQKWAEARGMSLLDLDSLRDAESAERGSSACEQTHERPRLQGE